MSENIKLSMPYDGPADDNPFKPKPGDTVAVCPHEPRPLHIQYFEDKPIVNGVAIRWFNVCRKCSTADRETVSTWRTCIWPGSS